MFDAVYGVSISGEPDEPVGGDKFDEIIENDFIKTADQNVSTFSNDADGASYAYMRKCLSMGIKPSPNAVRIEEYLNYFTFDMAYELVGERLSSDKYGYRAQLQELIMKAKEIK